MTALVGCYRGCGNRTAVVHSLGQVDSAIGGVVVVGEVTFGAGYRDIIDAIVAQHFFRPLRDRSSPTLWVFWSIS